MEEKQLSNYYEQFASFMKHDSKAVELFSYGIACACLSTALFKIRPFARFTKPNQVPNHFFVKKTSLEGTVENIEVGNPVCLLVDHKPIVPLPRLGSSKYLPVKIAGVNVNGNGLSWLQTVIKGQKITFLPVAKNNNFLTCIVMLPVKNKEPVSIAVELIKVGFGTVEKLTPISMSKEVKTYEKYLKRAQKWAERKRNGIWQEKYFPTIMWKLRIILENKLRSKLPKFLVKYLNI